MGVARVKRVKPPEGWTQEEFDRQVAEVDHALTDEQKERTLAAIGRIRLEQGLEKQQLTTTH